MRAGTVDTVGELPEPVIFPAVRQNRVRAILAQPQPALAEEIIVAVEVFLQRVAAVDHALAMPAQRFLYDLDPLLGLAGAHFSVASRVVLPVEHEQLVRIWRCEG